MKRLFRPYLSIFLLGSLLVTATSCGEDEPEPEPFPQEEIASARLVLEPEGKGALATINYGPNNQNPGAILKANTTYNGVLTLFDAEGNDITSEIAQEGDKHEVFYNPSTGLGITVDKTDDDANGNPIGLETTLTTTNAGTGTLTVVLKHQADKGASDPNKGETDLTMPINVTIQ